jgi:hypothetical protein
MLTGNGDLSYQGIPIIGAPSFDAGIAAGSPDTSSHPAVPEAEPVRRVPPGMKFETWRDPREGATSFVVTARVDAKVAVINATTLAYNVDVEP